MMYLDLTKLHSVPPGPPKKYLEYFERSDWGQNIPSACTGASRSNWSVSYRWNLRYHVERNALSLSRLMRCVIAGTLATAVHVLESHARTCHACMHARTRARRRRLIHVRI
jgi:hypothetical protein